MNFFLWKSDVFIYEKFIIKLFINFYEVFYKNHCELTFSMKKFIVTKLICKKIFIMNIFYEKLHYEYFLWQSWFWTFFIKKTILNFFH